MATRLYVVTNNDTKTVRLIDAASQGQAVKHCTKDHFSVKTATTKDVAFLVGNGCKVESLTNGEQVQS